MRKLGLLSILILSLLWIPQVNPSLTEGSSGSFGNPEAPPNWDEFWALFNTVSAWDLEYDQGDGWSSIKGDLTVLRNYPEPWLCKISLLFNASYHADYRLTFLINRRVQNYTHQENKTRYVITYQDYTVFFSWSDLLGIPGLQFSHGIIDYLEKPCFWFRLRRDNVPQGTYLELDPTFGCETEGSRNSNINDHIKAGNYTCTQNGMALNLTGYFTNAYEGATVKGGLYHGSNKSFYASTQEYTMDGSEGDSWVTLNFSVPQPQLTANTSYLLCMWGSSFAVPLYLAAEDVGGDPAYWIQSEDYGEWPETLGNPTSTWEPSLFCGYTTHTSFPTVGSFSSSQDPVYMSSWFSVNCTVEDQDGIADLSNSSLELSGNIILAWENSTGTFNIASDPQGYCTLNSTGCIEDEISSTAFTLSWRIKLATTYPHGSSVDVVAAHTLVYDRYGLNGTGSYSGLFVFEPEESGEPPGGPGGESRPEPGPELPPIIPSEVVPPEAQYGTIGLILILGGGVLYYVRRSKSTQQLMKKATASRVSYGPRKAPGKKRVKTKRSPKRKTQQKKQPQRRIHKQK